MGDKRRYGKNPDGSYSECKAKPENVGRYRCNHAEHVEMTPEEADSLNEKNTERNVRASSRNIVALVKKSREQAAADAAGMAEKRRRDHTTYMEAQDALEALVSDPDFKKRLDDAVNGFDDDVISGGYYNEVEEIDDIKVNYNKATDSMEFTLTSSNIGDAEATTKEHRNFVDSMMMGEIGDTIGQSQDRLEPDAAYPAKLVSIFDNVRVYSVPLRKNEYVRQPGSFDSRVPKMVEETNRSLDENEEFKRLTEDSIKRINFGYRDEDGLIESINTRMSDDGRSIVFTIKSPDDLSNLDKYMYSDLVKQVVSPVSGHYYALESSIRGHHIPEHGHISVVSNKEEEKRGVCKLAVPLERDSDKALVSEGSSYRSSPDNFKAMRQAVGCWFAGSGMDARMGTDFENEPYNSNYMTVSTGPNDGKPYRRVRLDNVSGKMKVKFFNEGSFDADDEIEYPYADAMKMRHDLVRFFDE